MLEKKARVLVKKKKLNWKRNIKKKKIFCKQKIEAMKLIQQKLIVLSVQHVPQELVFLVFEEKIIYHNKNKIITMRKQRSQLERKKEIIVFLSQIM